MPSINYDDWSDWPLNKLYHLHTKELRVSIDKFNFIQFIIKGAIKACRRKVILPFHYATLNSAIQQINKILQKVMEYNTGAHTE